MLLTAGRKLTWAGITHILSDAQKRDESIINLTVTPHVIRHSKAIHLLQARINLVYLTDTLGIVKRSHFEPQRLTSYWVNFFRIRRSARKKEQIILPIRI